jgi:hypothetical protein
MRCMVPLRLQNRRHRHGVRDPNSTTRHPVVGLQRLHARKLDLRQPGIDFIPAFFPHENRNLIQLTDRMRCEIGPVFRCHFTLHRLRVFRLSVLVFSNPGSLWILSQVRRLSKHKNPTNLAQNQPANFAQAIAKIALFRQPKIGLCPVFLAVAWQRFSGICENKGEFAYFSKVANLHEARLVNRPNPNKTNEIRPK